MEVFKSYFTVEITGEQIFYYSFRMIFIFIAGKVGRIELDILEVKKNHSVLCTSSFNDLDSDNINSIY